MKIQLYLVLFIFNVFGQVGDWKLKLRLCWCRVNGKWGRGSGNLTTLNVVSSMQIEIAIVFIILFHLIFNIFYFLSKWRIKIHDLDSEIVNRDWKRGLGSMAAQMQMMFNGIIYIYNK